MRLFVLTVLSLTSLAGWSDTTLNLQQAIELALQQDPRIEEKRAYVRKAEALLDEAEGTGGLIFSSDAYLAITTGLNGGFYEDGDESCSDDCKPRDDTYSFDDGFSLWSTLTFSIIKPLATFGQLENYQEAAKNNIVIKQQDVQLQQEAVKLDVVKAYYGYLAARDGRFLLEDTRKRLNGAMILVQDWIDEGEGKAKLADLYALQTGLGLIDSYLADIRAVENIAEEGLRLLTGIDAKESIEWADRRLMPEPLPEQSLEEWTELAIQNRVEFTQVEAGLNARRALVKAKKAATNPIVFAGVGGSFSYSPNRDRLDNPHIYDPFNHAAASPLIGMRWQWEAGAQSARVAQEQAELDAVIQLASFARKGIPFQVKEQYYYVQSKHESMLAMKQSAQSARRWMIAAYTDFEAGLEEAEKILTAMQAYVLAYAEYLKIVNDYNNHIAKLKSVSGDYQ